MGDSKISRLVEGLSPYLQLLKGETTTSTNPAVVLDGGASDDRAKLVNRAGSNSGGLCESGISTAKLAAGL